MSRPAKGDDARTAAAKPCVFRVSVTERRWLEAEAARAGVPVNALARNRALGLADDGGSKGLTETANRLTESEPRELAVEYDHGS